MDARAGKVKKPWNPGQFYLLLLCAPLAFFAVFFVWPVVRVVLRSVLEPTPGLTNYVRVLHDETFRHVLVATFGIAVVVTLVCLLIAYPLAYFISRQRGTFMIVTMGLILIPLWTSVVIRSYAWMILFQRNGLINQLLVGSGIIDEPVRILQTWTAVVIGMVHILLPFLVLPLINTMKSIDHTLLRAGRVLGAPPLTLFFRVYLPLTRSGAAAGVALVFITALGFYVTPALLGGAKGTMTAVLIEQQASTYLDWPLASTLATILMASTILVYIVYNATIGGQQRQPAQ